MSTILGPDGRPLDLSTVMRGIREPQTARMGPILGEFARHPAKGLTPARLAEIMVQAEAGELMDQLDLVDDMEERDAHLYAEMGKRRGAITGLEWSIEEPENATADEEALAEQVRDWVGMLSCTADGVTGSADVLLSAMCSGMLPGFAPIEMVWQLQADATGRQVLVPRCELQPQRWFTTSPDRKRFLLRSSTEMVPGTTYLPAKMGVELQPFAWLMHVHPARNGYLARMSLARVLFWPYLFKNYAVRDLAEFLEIYGLPLRLGKYPAGASDEEKLTLLQAVTQIGHNAAGIIPQSMMLEFQAAAAGTEVPFAAMWDRLDAAESKAILGQTLTASEGQHGTQALGNVHNDVRMDIRAADARLIERSFNAQLIHPLCALNVAGVNPRRLPRLVIDTGESEDLEAYANHLPKLAKGGLKIGVDWVHKKLRIPKAEDGEDLFQAPPEPAAPGAPGAPGLPPAPPRPGSAPGAGLRAQDRAALSGLITAALAGRIADQVDEAGPARDRIDELVDEQAAQWQPMLAPLIEPVLAALDKAVDSGESLAAFAARLPELVAQLDAQPLTEQLARGGFSSRLAGLAGVELDLTPDED